MKKITWQQGGFSVPKLGNAIEGETVNADDAVAKEMVDRGLAKYTRKEKKEVK